MEWTTYRDLPDKHKSTITGPVVEAWTARYGGPAKQTDELVDMAVDATGNIYVTGSITIRGSYKSRIDQKHDVDYMTIKYGEDGTRLWMNRYSSGKQTSIDLAKAMALDNEGNVLITGTAGTVKYDPDGRLLWANGTYLAMGIDLVVDDSDCIYVTGETGTAKYDGAGNELWHTEDGGQAIRLDSVGNVYVGCKLVNVCDGCSCERGTFNAIKYNSDGDMLWSRTPNVTENLTGTPDWPCNPSGVSASATGMAVDEAGNMYLVGWISTSLNAADIVTMKYDNSGTQQWVDYYPVPPGSDIRTDPSGWTYYEEGQSEASAVTLDKYGNVWVAGMSDRWNTNFEYLALEYDSDGNLGMVLRYDSPVENESSFAEAIAVDASGNVYLAGDSGPGFALVKYNGEGTQVWTVRSDVGFSAGPCVIAVDGSGNVYVAGSVPVGLYTYTNIINDTHDTYENDDFIIVKYSE